MSDADVSKSNAGATKVITALYSDHGDTGTAYFSAAILELRDQLRAKIEKAYQIVIEDDTIAEVRVHCQVDALAGSDYINCKERNQTEANLAALDAIEQALEEEEGGRIATPEEIVTFSRAPAPGVSYSVIVVTKYGAPYLAVHEKYGHECFRSPEITLLVPPTPARLSDAA